VPQVNKTKQTHLNKLNAMNVQIDDYLSNTPLFTLMNLTQFELELLQEGLIELKNNRMKDAEEFKAERHSCVEMYHAIDRAIVESKEAKKV